MTYYNFLRLTHNRVVRVIRRNFVKKNDIVLDVYFERAEYILYGFFCGKTNLYFRKYLIIN